MQPRMRQSCQRKILPWMEKRHHMLLYREGPVCLDDMPSLRTQEKIDEQSCRCRWLVFPDKGKGDGQGVFAGLDAFPGRGKTVQGRDPEAGAGQALSGT